jgi:hypothetical protein
MQRIIKHFFVKCLFENHAFCEIMWKNPLQSNRPQMATQSNKAHALCVLDNYGYKHILRLSNIYCFSTTTLATRSRLNIT